MDDPQKYLASFYIWDYIGGRYSATSMVGGVALAFAFGMDRFLDFLRGANAIDKLVLSKNPRNNLPLLSALIGIWNRNFLSLAHDGDHSLFAGPFPLSCPPATARYGIQWKTHRQKRQARRF